MFHSQIFSLRHTYYTGTVKTVLDLQPISWESPEDVACPIWLMPIKLLKYYFVPHHQHGQRENQEYP